MLIVVLPDKSPGVISLDFTKRLDEINNSQKSFNYIKKVLQECLLLFAGALLESFLFFLFSLLMLSGSYILPQFVSKNLVGSPLVIYMVVQR